jgi:fluoride ion exporter CrcB/FEX
MPSRAGGDRRELGAIFAGGVVGALLRVALLQTHAGAAPGWPWVTFASGYPKVNA